MSDASPGSRMLAERVLRGTAFAALALLLFALWPRSIPRGAGGQGTTSLPLPGGASEIARALVPVVATIDAADTLALDVTQLPDAAGRGVLHAATLSIPTTVRWRDRTGARGLAVEASALVDPAGGLLLRAVRASDQAEPLLLRDEAGVLDSSGARTSTRAVLVRQLAAAGTASAGASRARAAAPSALPVRRVLLYARPGWEAKFTAAALEEAGWAVDATLPVSPRVAVTVGAPRALDTARYAAAIVLDSGAANAAALSRFARSGGGVIVTGDATSDRTLAGLLPATPATATATLRGAVAGGLLTAAPRAGLEAMRLTPMSDAYLLERDPGDPRGAPGIVVMRRGSGRVLVTAYRESWRWRMAGGEGSAEAHRAWWGALLRAVAFAPLPAVADNGIQPGIAPSDAAPWASLVDRLGPPVAPDRTASSGTTRLPVRGPSVPPPWLLLMVVLIALLLEWGSRRTRGAR